jgi:hypothetical protein
VSYNPAMIDAARDMLLAVTAGLALAPSSLDTIRARAPGVVVRGDTLGWDRSPAPGGLVDPLLFGESGDRFARIVLAGPVPHPLMDGGEVLLRELPVLPPALRSPRARPSLLKSSLEVLYGLVLLHNRGFASALRIGIPEAPLRHQREKVSHAILRLFANRVVERPSLGLDDEPHAALLDLAREAEPQMKRAILFALALDAS